MTENGLLKLFTLYISLKYRTYLKISTHIYLKYNVSNTFSLQIFSIAFGQFTTVNMYWEQ